MFYFTEKGLPLFPKVSPQQLHEVFIKNSASTDQCPLKIVPQLFKNSAIKLQFMTQLNLLMVQLSCNLNKI